MGLTLIILSVILYVVHYGIFGDIHHILIYGLGDLAFLPIEVLLVTLIIHRLIGEREKRIRLQKLNMVIGVFFSEVGTHLLAYLSDLDPKQDKIRKDLIVTGDWSGEEFQTVSKRLRNYDYEVDVQNVKLEKLRDFLLGRREFLLRLLGKPKFAGT